MADTTTAEARPRRAPAPRPGLSERGRWHLRAGAVVLSWVAVAMAVRVVAALPGDRIAAPRWLSLHALLAGAATTAIVVWSGHFTAALCRTAATSRRAEATRLGLLQLGLVLVLVAVPHGWSGPVLAGAAVLAVALGWHVASLLRMLRAALGPRLGIVVWWYVAAAAMMLAGGAAGVLLALGAPGPVPTDRLLGAHVVLMLLGWVGLTVLGTLVTLWPTVLRTRMDERSDAAARRALWLCTGGISAAAGGFLLPFRSLAAAGFAAVVLGVAVLLVPLAATARRRRPRTGAAWSLAAAMGWFAAVLLAMLVAVVAGGHEQALSALDRLVPVAAVGFVGQALLGALSALLPAVLGGGPHAARRAIARLERGWRYRLAALNAGLLAAALPLPRPVHLAGELLVVLGAAVPFLVLATALLLSRRFAVPPEPPTAPPAAAPGGRPSERRAVLGGIAAGLVLLLVAVLAAVSGRGSAPDPAASAVPAAATGPAATRTMAVTLQDMRIRPGTLSVPAGTHLILDVTNRDGMRHDLAVPGGKRTPMLSRGQRAQLDVGVVTRALTLHCTVPGHAAAGMVMAVNVTGVTGVTGVTPEGAASAAGRSAAAAFDPMATPAASDPYRDPRLAPVAAGRLHRITLHASDRLLTVAPGVRQLMWTFNGTVPGPILHGRVGDTFNITVVNDTTMNHSIDFHAGEVAPDEVMRAVPPGRSLHYRFRADHSGIWMYHCATAPMIVHIGNGMYGAVVVDPPNLPPVDQEYAIVQSEFYLGAQGGTGNAAAMLAGTPDAVVFNGQSNQYDSHPLTARPGQRVRIWVLDAGLSQPGSFHVVGTQFDTVFSEGAYLVRPGNAEHGAAQVLALQPAQGGFVEFTVPAAGHYPILSHRMVDAARGAHGLLVVR